jgi:hypothetical protein
MKIMTKLPILEFYCYGQVSQDDLHEIRNILEECYSRLGEGQKIPDRVEVRLFKTSDQSLEFLQKEKKELGIGTSGDEAFICSHDAWRGYSRLSVCLERLNTLSPIARLGALRHEVAHSVLHGGPEYYTVRIPEDCVELARTKGMAPALLQQVLYYCAIAVKDFEVTRLLLKSGYSECQVAFIESVFIPGEEDKLAWSLLSSHPQGKFIFFYSQLKTLLTGISLEIAGLVELERWNDQMLFYVSPKERRHWLVFARNLALQLDDITQENIQLVLRSVLVYEA